MTSVHQAPAAPAPPTFDPERLRADFPLLKQRRNGRPLVYLDNAATSQKPKAVIEAITHYYATENANIHRGVYFLSGEATAAYEAARTKVQRFLNAGRADEIVFVRGATEAINLVAQSYGRTHFRPGDEVVLSAMEHHSNIVPWQLICAATGARIRVIPITDRGDLIFEEYERLLGDRTKLVAIVHVSNSLGTINPVREMVALAHDRGVPVLVDGAQAAPHLRIDVRGLDCDFYAISGHKMFGPTGIGVLYGKADLLDAMPPYQSGGDMIRAVRFDKTVFAPPPSKFEAGTPHISGAVGLGAAIGYLEGIDPLGLANHEAAVLQHAACALSAIPGIRLIGTAKPKASVLSFVVEGVHAHDVGTVLDQEGICVRTGHHCTQPLMERLGVPATARASFAFYNTHDEVDRLAAAVARVREVFA